MKRILIKNIRANFALLTQETKGHRWNYLIGYMSDNRIRGLASLSFFPGGIGATASGNPEVELGKEFSHPPLSAGAKLCYGGNYDAEFIEWFRGFTDAEGCFMIVHLRDNF
jgi:hypothetical protein